MNPAKISISDCHLDAPVKKSSGKISFCLLPCLHNDKRLQVKLATKFKIFAHQEESFSLGITIPEEHLEFFKGLEKHLNSAAMKLKKEINKIGISFARFHEGDFTLVKTDKSEQEMSKRSHALWMKFWWKKWCRLHLSLKNMKTRMRMMSELFFLQKEKRTKKKIIFLTKNDFSFGENFPEKIPPAEKSCFC